MANMFAEKVINSKFELHLFIDYGWNLLNKNILAVSYNSNTIFVYWPFHEPNHRPIIFLKRKINRFTSSKRYCTRFISWIKSPILTFNMAFAILTLTFYHIFMDNFD